jgi:hypothetical protein
MVLYRQPLKQYRWFELRYRSSIGTHCMRYQWCDSWEIVYIVWIMDRKWKLIHTFPCQQKCTLLLHRPLYTPRRSSLPRFENISTFSRLKRSCSIYRWPISQKGLLLHKYQSWVDNQNHNVGYRSRKSPNRSSMSRSRFRCRLRCCCTRHKCHSESSCALRCWNLCPGNMSLV